MGVSSLFCLFCLFVGYVSSALLALEVVSVRALRIIPCLEFVLLHFTILDVCWRLHHDQWWV